MIVKPVVLAATAGSSRHALVVDEQMRSLFAYMRALTLPASVFAAPEDWGTAELGERIRRAATELAVVLQAQIEQGIADRAWSGYRHELGGKATRAEQTNADVDFDSPLMRLAAGGQKDRGISDERVTPTARRHRRAATCTACTDNSRRGSRCGSAPFGHSGWPRSSA